MNNLQKTEKSNKKLHYSIAVFVAFVLLVFSILFGLISGSADIELISALSVILEKININIGFHNDYDALVVGELRLPRVLSGVFIGAALSISGAVMQGLFRNPLADPALIGIAGGSALGAVVAISFGAAIFGVGLMIALPVFAFLGAVIATYIAYTLATYQGKTSVTALLLAGIAINALTGAGYGFFLFIADDAQLRSITFWSLGSLSGLDYNSLYLIAFSITPIIAVILLFSQKLNLMMLGEAEAYFLGVNVEQTKRILILLISLAIGLSTASAGIIGFVGLLVPHIIRIAIGGNHKILLPLSAILGGALLVVADMFARTLVAPAEMPIGILTTGIGGPFLLWLLLRERKKENIF